MNAKLILLMALIISSNSIASSNTIRLSEPVQRDESSETFGVPLPTMPKPIAIKTLLQEPESHLDNVVSIEARVAKVCQKKGCFFIAQQGKDALRVTFKDYGFFVPTNISGRQVTLVGQLVARDISPSEAKHLSQDLGTKEGITSGKKYEIVATSVRIPFE